MWKRRRSDLLNCFHLTFLASPLNKAFIKMRIIASAWFEGLQLISSLHLTRLRHGRGLTGCSPPAACGWAASGTRFCPSSRCCAGPSRAASPLQVCLRCATERSWGTHLAQSWTSPPEGQTQGSVCPFYLFFGRHTTFCLDGDENQERRQSMRKQINR